MKAWREKNFERCLCLSAKHRAEKQGLPFDLAPEDIVVPSHCPVLGIPLERKGGLSNPRLASIDKIDPTKGYVRGNVWIISWRANSLKRDGTLAEFEAIVRALRSLEVHDVA